MTNIERKYSKVNVWISYMEPLFVVAKIIDHLEKIIAYFFIHNCFKCDYDHYEVLSVIMTITKICVWLWPLQ